MKAVPDPRPISPPGDAESLAGIVLPGAILALGQVDLADVVQTELNTMSPVTPFQGSVR